MSNRVCWYGLLLSILALSKFSFAQTDSLVVSDKRYFNQFTTGALIGCGYCPRGKDFTLSVMTMHGARLTPTVKVGLGVGMDVYNDWRLFPLMAGIIFDREQRNNSFFLQINAGYAWGRFLAPEPWWASDFKERGGFTFNPMFGFRIGKDKLRIQIQTGYKYQAARTTLENISAWGGNTTKREYDLNRFIFKLGFGLR